ncbi:ATP synthase subunit I [Clostridium sp. MCC353]|uniref:ATP synthase subunit I n=1 Tax=Clostridium sp. MCC353 TaxID=2592646 RepID=UPI001C00A7BE|nr:ATP synthase subunit I [Clostridium sp. MCC353]MBT9780088.1 ATP synthase subunit I [Clostridium sp. MCC353]
MSRETKNLILEMSVGIVIFEVVLGIGAAVIGSGLGAPLSTVILGLFCGLIADIAMLIHMAVITERVLDTGDESYANKTTVVHSMLRKLVIVVLVIVLWRVPQVNIVAFIIGALGLKAGAYLQPFIHKAFNKR